MTYYAGIDLGGTKIAVGIFDANTGALVFTGAAPTHAAEGPDAVMARIARFASDTFEQAGIRPRAVGLGVPAVLDFECGCTLLLPNLPGNWYRRPVVAELEEALNLPVALINDARAFTLAESTVGAGSGASTVVCVTVGTGIGGGVAFNGHLHTGLDGVAGELGHQTIEPDGPVCGCGNRGCLEALAGGRALIARGVESITANHDSVLYRLADGNPDAVTPELVMRAADAGDTEAAHILTRAGTYLGIGIANVITILSPDCVVIGGGLTQLGDWIFNPVRETVRARCRTTPIDKIRIVRAALGQQAGIIGAAICAAQRIQQHQEM
jgi:glucokinase